MRTIYEPNGKAAEYAAYAVNFYNGCSNGCEYCYLKRGVLKKTLGGDKPVLQKRYNSEKHALTMFCAELKKKAVILREKGLFFTFSSDPCLDETWKLNADAIIEALTEEVPCTILTKNAGMVVNMIDYIEHRTFNSKELLAIGFTLTGCDRLEPNASKNWYRAKAMRILHERGYRIWASIEPIIDVDSSLGMMLATMDYCDHYKVGLRSGVKKDYYSKSMLLWMLRQMAKIPKPIYLKDSFVEFIRLDRSALVDVCASVEHGMFVGADFNIFKNK